MGTSQLRTSYPATITLLVALGLALIVSIGLCNAVVGVTELPAIVIVTVVSVLLGAGSEGLGDALMFCVIVAGVTAIGITFIPLAPFWAQTWLAFSAGVTTSKIVWGAYIEFFRQPMYDDPMHRPRPMDSARDSHSKVIREYDTVRIVKLKRHNRAFCGTEAVRRAPHVGDVATIVHEHEPHDPLGDVAAEMVDADGYTIWLADFEKSELELVKRP